jgi:hypothetical protein
MRGIALPYRPPAAVASGPSGGYRKGVAKRMLLHFQKGGFPAYECADEQGMPQPCALGIPWVNADTQRTLAKVRIPRTDPWGRPLPEPEAEEEVPGSR